MKITAPLTDTQTLDLIEGQLEMVTARYSHSYHSAEEMLGVLTEGYHELIDAIRDGNGQITTTVLSELIYLAVV